MDREGSHSHVCFCAGRALGVLCALCILGVAGVDSSLTAHDLERTQVVLTFARDGSFVLDVLNDPVWLKERLANFRGPFSDRVVLWVDGHEIRPTSEEYLAPPPTPPGDLPAPGVHRLRGRMPLDAKSLRWYYGLVIDPYPLTLRRADGRIVVEEIAGDAWSGSIDLAGQFHASTWFNDRITSIVLIVAILLVPPIVWLSRSRR